MNTIIFIIALFFSSFGIIFLLNKIKYLLFNIDDNKNTPSSLIFIPISGHIEDVELLARKYKAACKSNYILNSTKIFFIDNGLDKETIKICKKLENENYLKLCNSFQIYAILKENFKPSL